MKDKDIKKYIGARLKELRENAGLKQEDVAGVLKLSRVSILNMESGRHCANYFNLYKLSCLFNCSLNEIFPPINATRFVIETKTVNVKRQVKRIKILKA